MPSQPFLPPQLGGYRLRRLLGRGAFGEVWEAEAPGGVAVAVKILHRTRQPAEAQRELEALDVIKGLRHLHLLSLQAFYALDDRLFVVLELADGSLRQRLRACRDAGLSGIPAEELLRYLAETAEALDFLHARKVLHRDIKPDNLLLVGGHVKVADFGLARLLEATSLHTASLVGTPLYMAPEVWQNKVNFTADQYALACTYAELRTGRYPFPGDHPAAVMHAHLMREPEADVPEEERQVLLRALAKDAAERFPTCVAFVNALTAAARQPSPSHLSRSPQPVDAAPRDCPRTAAPQTCETDHGALKRTTSSPRRRLFLPLFVLGVLAFPTVGVLVWRTRPTAAPPGNDVELAAADERVKAGRAALDRGDFATALDEALGAERLAPGHAGATALHTEAAAVRKDAAAKHIRAARAALRDRRSDDAVREAAAAFKILADKEATDLLADTKSAQAADILARKKAAEVAKLVAAGKRALADKNFAVAIRAAKDALQFWPNDKEATELLAEAESAQAADALARQKTEAAKALAADMPALAEQKVAVAFRALQAWYGDAQAAAMAQQKTRDEAAELVQVGKAALADKQYDNALTAAKAALKLVSDDRGATELLAAIARQKQDDAAQLVQQGRAALRRMQFDDARKAANAALALVPLHPDALALRREADTAEAQALKMAASRDLTRSPVGRWLTEQESMGARVKMDLRIAEGGKWNITLSGGFAGRQAGTYEMVGDKNMSLTFRGFDGKEKTVRVAYRLSEDALVMPNPNNLSEELSFKRHK